MLNQLLSYAGLALAFGQIPAIIIAVVSLWKLAMMAAGRVLR